KVLPIEKSHALIDRLFTNYFYKDVIEFHERDRNFIVSDKCTSCGLCIKKCPVGNITMKNGKPKWNHKCELCLSCIQSCPKEAINYGEKTKGRKRYLNPNVKM
ncbi:EFR1 family ferrodoxin, partial [uncultured Clostridium sp.]|uniref:EFR1 family ferrodoxin n=1 Tax=uncultured Clostridium sp. TaxID=59620 RepID=UPI0025CC057E